MSEFNETFDIEADSINDDFEDFLDCEFESINDLFIYVDCLDQEVSNDMYWLSV